MRTILLFLNQEQYTIAFIIIGLFLWSLFGLFFTTHLLIDFGSFINELPFLSHSNKTKINLFLNNFKEISENITSLYRHENLYKLYKLLPILFFLKIFIFVLNIYFIFFFDLDFFIFKKIRELIYNFFVLFIAFIIFLISINELKLILTTLKKNTLTFYYFCHFAILKFVIVFLFFFPIVFNIYTNWYLNKNVGRVLYNFLESNIENINFIFSPVNLIFVLITIFFLIIFIFYVKKKYKYEFSKLFLFSLFLPSILSRKNNFFIIKRYLTKKEMLEFFKAAGKAAKKRNLKVTESGEIKENIPIEKSFQLVKKWFSLTNTAVTGEIPDDILNSEINNGSSEKIKKNYSYLNKDNKNTKYGLNKNSVFSVNTNSKTVINPLTGKNQILPNNSNGVTTITNPNEKKLPTLTELTQVTALGGCALTGVAGAYYFILDEPLHYTVLGPAKELVREVGHHLENPEVVKQVCDVMSFLSGGC